MSFQIKNKIDAPCIVCGTHVPQGDGLSSRAAGRWYTVCASSRCIIAKGLQVPDAPAPRRLGYDAGTGTGWVEMPYDAAALPLLKSFPGQRWDKATCRRYVSTEPEDRPRVLEIATQLGLEPDAWWTEPLQEDTTLDQLLQRAQDAGLYPFQVQGVERLAASRHVLLGDDMGLGKTVQVLMALAPDARALVVCPAAVKYNWRDECRRWRPDLEPVVINGRGNCRPPAAGEVVIVNYDILPGADQDCTYREAGYDGIVLVADEAHLAKNYKARRTQRVTGLAQVAARVWFLTGTPLANRPFDLYGVLRAGGMAGKAFGGSTGWGGFIRAFRGYKNRWGGYEFGGPTAAAPEMLRRVMLRRTKTEVLPNLPRKRHQTIPVNGTTAKLRRQLDDLWDEWGDVLAGGELPPFEIFSKVRAALAASRIKAMEEYVASYEDADVPLVVFSAHRAPIDALACREGWETITGATDAQLRADIVRRFQAGELKGVGLTIAAGGVGLTLTRASHLLFVDLAWRPCDNAQAEDRCCRIGQTADAVHVIRFVSDHQLDQHVLQLLHAKQLLIEAAVERRVQYTPPPDAGTWAHTETEEEWAARVAAFEAAQAEAERQLHAQRVEEICARQRERSGARDPKLTRALVAQLQDAHAYMLSVCDGAVADDGMGFSKPDAGLARALVQYDLDSREAQLGLYHLLRRYHRQLSDDYPAIFGGAR